MKFFALSLSLSLILLSGCAIQTTTTRTQTSSGRLGVEIQVLPNGTLNLYGHPIEQKHLIKRLKSEETAHKGRAVILQAKGDVSRAHLEDLRTFLVRNGIPNVVIVTQRNAVSFEGKQSSEQ